MKKNNRAQPRLKWAQVDKFVILSSAVITLIYITWWLNPDNPDNIVLYGLLFIGEVFHIFLLFVLLNTLWPRKDPPVSKAASVPDVAPGIVTEDAKLRPFPSVDVYIPVAGEPVDIIENTVRAAMNIRYADFKVYVLNDGYVANSDNWKDVERLANGLGAECITRTIPGGAKAGNINHALDLTDGEIIVILDADMVAYEDLLEKVIPYFRHDNVGFVQTPQYYKNFDKNEVTRAAWEQQEFFYGPIMVGKSKTNSSFICGTNVAIRRRALLDVGGVNTGTITEDILTSLHVHQKGWKSHYLPEVLTEGLAPEDMLSYFKQQLRWARGGLDLFFRFNPLFKRGLTFAQRMEYLSSSLYYASGIVILIDIIMPIAYLLIGAQPVRIATTTFALFFMPYIFLLLYIMYRASDGAITFRAFSFSFSSFTIQLQALWSILTGKKMGFVVTPKKGQQGRYLFLAYPHLLYITVFAFAAFWAVFREGLTAAVAINVAWGLFNVILFIPFIKAAYEQV